MEIRLARSTDIPGWVAMRQSLWLEEEVDTHAVEAAELLEKPHQWAVWVAERAVSTTAVSTTAVSTTAVSTTAVSTTAVSTTAVSTTETLVGFLEASLREYVDGCETSPVGYMEGIYVKPEFRQQGISRMLVREMENWAKSRGCTEVASDAELSNLISQRMHQQLGFDEVARIVIFRKEI